MYTWVWAAIILGVLLVAFFVFFLVKDIENAKLLKKSKIKFLLPDGLLMITAAGLIVSGVFLYLAIQSQLLG